MLTPTEEIPRLAPDVERTMPIAPVIELLPRMPDVIVDPDAPTEKMPAIAAVLNQWFSDTLDDVEPDTTLDAEFDTQIGDLFNNAQRDAVDVALNRSTAHVPLDPHDPQDMTRLLEALRRWDPN